jgi:hypothetical protein
VRDFFYGDNRDLVKWGVLLQLAERFGAARILQVGYYRPEGRWPPLEIDGRECPIPDEVIRHFRSCRDIKRLNSLDSLGVQINVLDSPFSHRERDVYLQQIFAAMSGLDPRPCILFLDPDTGIGRDAEHVRPGELLAIWDRMRGGDVLVLYQHAHHKKQWLEIRRREFEGALRLPAGAARHARGGMLTAGKRFCRDVAFFFIQKSDATSPS